MQGTYSDWTTFDLACDSQPELTCSTATHVAVDRTSTIRKAGCLTCQRTAEQLFSLQNRANQEPFSAAGSADEATTPAAVPSRKWCSSLLQRGHRMMIRAL
jgi:hypothetical protein